MSQSKVCEGLPHQPRRETDVGDDGMVPRRFRVKRSREGERKETRKRTPGRNSGTEGNMKFGQKRANGTLARGECASQGK